MYKVFCKISEKWNNVHDMHLAITHLSISHTPCNLMHLSFRTFSGNDKTIRALKETISNEYLLYSIYIYILLIFTIFFANDRTHLIQCRQSNFFYPFFVSPWFTKYERTWNLIFYNTQFYSRVPRFLAAE